jgi:ATP-dependent DNA helicase PIF1
MFIKNVDETLVNGSMGKVIGFTHKVLYMTDTSGEWRPDGDHADLDIEEQEKRDRMRAMIMAKISPQSKPSPVVRFSVPGGGFRDILVEADVFKSELPNGEVQVSRSQVRFAARYRY